MYYNYNRNDIFNYDSKLVSNIYVLYFVLRIENVTSKK